MKTLQTSHVWTSRDVAPHTRNTRDSQALRPSTSPLTSSFSSVSRHRCGTEIAYYGHPEAERLLVEGIPLEDDCAGCPEHHICLGWSPELSANFGPVLEVDIAGLPVVWEKGEGRIHESISADRVLRIVSGPIVPSWDGWEDPAIRINHKACLALLESSPAPSPDKEKESSGV